MRKSFFKQSVVCGCIMIMTVFLLKAYGNYDPEDKVDPDMVKFMARKVVEDTWGQCTVGPLIKCFAPDGTLSSYFVILKLGDTNCPNSDQLLSEIDQKKQIYQNTIESNKNQSRYNGQAFKNARRQLWGVGEYCTVEVSAFYKYFPIPHYFQGLPAYLMNLKASQRAVKEITGKTRMQLKYYNLGHGGEYFSYSDPEENVLFEAYSLELIKKSKKFLNEQLSKPASNLDIADQISESWKAWLKRYHK